MTVLNRFACPIPEEVKVRGTRYAAGGAVNVQYVTESTLVALVQGENASYRTTLEWETASELDFSCTCGRFLSSQEICGHVVAAALAAEANGRLPQGAAGRPAGVIDDRPLVWLSPTGKLRRSNVEDPRPLVRHRPAAPSWKRQLARVREAGENGADGRADWPADRQILYVIEISASSEEGRLVVRLACRDRKQSGEWSRPKTRGISFPAVDELREAEDQQVVALLKGASGGSGGEYSYDPVYRVGGALAVTVIERMCRTGRAFARPDAEGDDLTPLAWDEAGAWELWLEGQRDDSSEQYVLSGWLRRGEERMPLSRPMLVLGGGLVITREVAAGLIDAGAGQWISILRQQRGLAVPFAQGKELLSELLSIAQLPRLDLPEELRVEEVRTAPKPLLHIRAPGGDELRPDRLRAVLAFEYDGVTIGPDGAGQAAVFDGRSRRLVIRDLPAEREAVEKLRQLGMRETGPAAGMEGLELWFSHRHLPRIVRRLAQAGWHVEADGKLYRTAGRVRLSVTSGMDWFELRGGVEFDGRAVELPVLLAAARRGESMVQLDDGTFGILPEEWLKKYGLLASVGTEEERFIQFGKAQAGLLDVLLASHADATFDETFERARRELRSFSGVEPLDAPAGFVGELRGYQREGLGWFDFLRRFGLGGCLADDMGLGKTVQVLALLEARRTSEVRGSGFGVHGAEEEGEGSGAGTEDSGAGTRESSRRPSLVVVPKSLVFNWKLEAQRFTPGLRILDHTGLDRPKSAEELSGYDLVITTYGTLRRDIGFLRDAEFDYLILDEAQAVKNAASESAKAARLLKGHHRLALSGTPVQNHLGDLWSLFEFLNPGMLGSVPVFADGQGASRNPDAETRGVLSTALRPFILRRTKEQVAADLPARVEQTLYCELEGEQRKLYDEMREYYRRSLLERIGRDGLNQSRMQILEALLRLRQAALHPALIDPERQGEASAKLDVLLPQLSEVVEEGHKALVFSQFTSMLALVRNELDKAGIVYEYLDGKTKDRGAHVERFQNDPDCKLFLISLKAGGLGLNLTAADYVFLLDPWWNPAVEAQAIDRAHRIGQTKQVFACRLIARDTVEEKVLALQQSKRELADAIISANNSLLRELGPEDLELLLS